MRRKEMKHKLSLSYGAVQGMGGQWEEVGSVEEAAEFIFNTKLKAYSVLFPFKNRLLTSWSILTLFCLWGNAPFVAATPTGFFPIAGLLVE